MRTKRTSFRQSVKMIANERGEKTLCIAKTMAAKLLGMNSDTITKEVERGNMSYWYSNLEGNRNTHYIDLLQIKDLIRPCDLPAELKEMYDNNEITIIKPERIEQPVVEATNPYKDELIRLLKSGDVTLNQLTPSIVNDIF